MRFFTVPTAQAARTSVIWAMAIIGGFYGSFKDCTLLARVLAPDALVILDPGALAPGDAVVAIVAEGAK